MNEACSAIKKQFQVGGCTYTLAACSLKYVSNKQGHAPVYIYSTGAEPRIVLNSGGVCAESKQKMIAASLGQLSNVDCCGTVYTPVRGTITYREYYGNEEIEMKFLSE